MRGFTVNQTLLFKGNNFTLEKAAQENQKAIFALIC
jgi:hypothetical protein